MTPATYNRHFSKRSLILENVVASVASTEVLQKHAFLGQYGQIQELKIVDGSEHIIFYTSEMPVSCVNIKVEFKTHTSAFLAFLALDRMFFRGSKIRTTFEQIEETVDNKDIFVQAEGERSKVFRRRIKKETIKTLITWKLDILSWASKTRKNTAFPNIWNTLCYAQDSIGTRNVFEDQILNDPDEVDYPVVELFSDEKPKDPESTEPKPISNGSMVVYFVDEQYLQDSLHSSSNSGSGTKQARCRCPGCILDRNRSKFSQDTNQAAQ